LSTRILLYAIEKNQIEAAKELLKQGILKNKPLLAKSILDVAIKNSNPEFVTILLEAGATRKDILLRQMKICARHIENTLQIYMKLVAYGTEINSNETDNKDISTYLNSRGTDYHREFLIFKYQYLAIDKLMRQAQQSNPENLTELIKGLLNAYLDRSFFLTSNYKSQAKELLFFISDYNGNDPASFIHNKFKDMMSKELGNKQTFRSTYQQMIITFRSSEHNLIHFLTRPHEYLHQPLEILSDPFLVLCEFIIDRQEQLDWFLKPTPLLCKKNEIVITNNAKNSVELTTNDKPLSIWDIAAYFFSSEKTLVALAQVADDELSSEDENKFYNGL